ncbi:MAG: PQQ-dependent sugar dehydrogenase [Steroidobacteraceae bacterium]
MRFPRVFQIARSVLLVTAAAALLACAGTSKVPVQFGPGADVQLPEPDPSLIPTLNVAPAQGWPSGRTPTAAPGFVVTAYAKGLDHPRWLYVLPDGDVLVGETNAPQRPDDAKGVRGWAMRKLMKRAGSAAPSANRITLLRGTNGSGGAVTRTTFLQGLHSPFGMALVGTDFYVANTDSLMRFSYHEGETQLTGPGTKLADLPAGPIDHHWTKNLIASRDGKHLYVTVGSNSNAGENGLAAEAGRARIIEVDPASGRARPFATGLRNPNGMGWDPQSGALWTAVNERDELGNDLVPDYMTSVRDGGFYGWPFSYYGRHLDPRVKEQNETLVARAIIPDYALGSHTASLGLTFYLGRLFPARYSGGAFIGQHGSWNRKPRSGYKVIFVPFANGQPSGPPEDILTGFLSDTGNAFGRPVGVAVDRSGALLVADDVGNTVWRVTRISATQ